MEGADTDEEIDEEEEDSLLRIMSTAIMKAKMSELSRNSLGRQGRRRDHGAPVDAFAKLVPSNGGTSLSAGGSNFENLMHGMQTFCQRTTSKPGQLGGSMRTGAHFSWRTHSGHGTQVVPVVTGYPDSRPASTGSVASERFSLASGDVRVVSASNHSTLGSLLQPLGAQATCAPLRFPLWLQRSCVWYTC